MHFVLEQRISGHYSSKQTVFIICYSPPNIIYLHWCVQAYLYDGRNKANKPIISSVQGVVSALIVSLTFVLLMCCLQMYSCHFAEVDLFC